MPPPISARPVHGQQQKDEREKKTTSDAILFLFDNNICYDQFKSPLAAGSPFFSVGLSKNTLKREITQNGDFD